jgi:hypothetical protein
MNPEIDAFGEVVSDGFRCAVASAEEATEVEGALEAAGATASDGRDRSFLLGDRARRLQLTITLDPILPLDESGCEGASLPF